MYQGLEQVLKRATEDATFRTELLAKRSAAVDAIGMTLAQSERDVLDSVSQEMLEATIARTKAQAGDQFDFAQEELVATLGIQPDEPATRGIRPDPPQVTQGVRPDPPMPPAPTGIRPDIPDVKVTGSRPDMPRERSGCLWPFGR